MSDKNPRQRCAPHPAGSFPAGFRTTAPVLVDRPVMGPSSETLNTKSGSCGRG